MTTIRRGSIRFRIIRLLSTLIFFTLIGQNSAFADDPAYYPNGPQTDVPISSIRSGGWTQCYSATMGTQDVILQVEALCAGSQHILYAGRATGSETILLLAAGETDTVLELTEVNATNLNNGSYWYFNDRSIGFAPSVEILQGSADVCASTSFPNACVTRGDGALRLSLHSSSGGWRIGLLDFLNNSFGYEKLFFVSQGSPAFLRLTQISVPTIGASGSTLTCTAGRYGIADSEVAVDGLTYTLYINGAPASITPQVSLNKASFDLGSAKNYSAYCQVQAQGYSSVITSSTETFIDQAKKAEIAAAAQVAEAATEAQRAAATAANFTAEARAMRKRIAERAGN